MEHVPLPMVADVQTQDLQESDVHERSRSQALQDGGRQQPRQLVAGTGSDGNTHTYPDGRHDREDKQPDDGLQKLLAVALEDLQAYAEGDDALVDGDGSEHDPHLGVGLLQPNSQTIEDRVEREGAEEKERPETHGFGEVGVVPGFMAARIREIEIRALILGHVSRVIPA